MKEYQNFKDYPIILSGPDGELIKLAPGQKSTLSEFYMKYVPSLMIVSNQEPTNTEITGLILPEIKVDIPKPTIKPHIRMNRNKIMLEHLDWTKEYENIVKTDQYLVADQFATINKDTTGVTYIVPFRCQERMDAIATVIKNIKAQNYPNIEIIVTEHDAQQQFTPTDSVRHIFTQSNGPFNKAIAYNSAVKLANFGKIILHDADIIVPTDYTTKMMSLLDKHDGVHIGKAVYYLSKGSTIAACKSGKFDDSLIIDRVARYFEGGSLGCHYNTYLNVGGFNDEFDGYGNEDTEFYSRLSNYKSFGDERTINFFHLWHGRTPGWDKYYEKNQELEKTLNAISTTKRMNIYKQRLISVYGYEPR